MVHIRLFGAHKNISQIDNNLYRYSVYLPRIIKLNSLAPTSDSNTIYIFWSILSIILMSQLFVMVESCIAKHITLRNVFGRARTRAKTNNKPGNQNTYRTIQSHYNPKTLIWEPQLLSIYLYIYFDDRQRLAILVAESISF